MTIDATGRDFMGLNAQIRECSEQQITVTGCIGQRYIGDGLSGKELHIVGTPGNGLGAYMNGSRLIVTGNAQDATGDTMNDGEIIIHGSSGDATGYAMRGGRIFVRDHAGYRAGIHMKAYQEKLPVLIIGGRAGSFLGEYQAGGLIVVLGLSGEGPLVGNFCAVGMHGGRMFLRTDTPPRGLNRQVTCAPATKEDLDSIDDCLTPYCGCFGLDKAQVLDHPFLVLTPDTQNPYQQLYTYN